MTPTPGKPDPEEIDDDPRDLEDREDYLAAVRNLQQSEGASHTQRSEGLIQRIGLTPLLGGAAAVIAIAVAIFNSLSSQNGVAPDSPPPAAISSSGFNVSDYWHGTPSGTSQPLIFHVLIAESVMTPGTPSRPGSVLGTMRNPCLGNAVIRIDSGSWDGEHLQLRVTQTGTGKPLTLEATRKDDKLNGTVTQDTYNGQITLERGEIACPR